MIQIIHMSLGQNNECPCPWSRVIHWQGSDQCQVLCQQRSSVTNYQGSHLTSQPVNHSAIRGPWWCLINQSETSTDDSWPIRRQTELAGGSLNLPSLDAGDVMTISSMCVQSWTKISLLSDEGISLWFALWFPNFVNESEPTVDIWQEHKTLKFNLPCQRDMHYFTFQTQAAK